MKSRKLIIIKAISPMIPRIVPVLPDVVLLTESLSNAVRKVSPTNIGILNYYLL